MVFDPREFNAVIENGVIRPDEPLNLPEHTRLRVTVEAVATGAEKKQKTVRSLREIRELGLVNSGGVKFSRDELHERD